MDGVLQSRQAVLNGIANGIDMEEWDPATDKTIPQNYSARDLSGGPPIYERRHHKSFIFKPHRRCQ